MRAVDCSVGAEGMWVEDAGAVCWLAVRAQGGADVRRSGG